MTKIRDNFDFDTTFDADDVDLHDMIACSVGIHGTMCPEIATNTNTSSAFPNLFKNTNANDRKPVYEHTFDH